MRKKILILLLGLVGIFCVVHEGNKILNAVGGSTYLAGGNVTGRINKNPSNLVVKNNGMKKGDRIHLDTGNLEMQLIKDVSTMMYAEGVTDYTQPAPLEPYGNGTWFTLSSKPASASKVKNGWDGITPSTDFSSEDPKNLINSEILKIQNQLDQYPLEKQMIRFRKFAGPIMFPHKANLQQKGQIYIFSPIMEELFQRTNTLLFMNLTENDISANFDWWYPTCWGTDGFTYIATNSGKASKESSANGMHYIRAGAYINLDSVVFGISESSLSGTAVITTPTYTEGGLMHTSTGKAMKLRINDNTHPMTIQFGDIYRNSKLINSVYINSKLDLKVKANKGNVATGGENTVSALLFDHMGNFKYYQPLGEALGDDKEYNYELDLKDIPAGQYSISLVNEVYYENSLGPTYSSLLSDIKPITIVDSILVSVNSKAQLQYKNNVSQNDPVATISSTGGVDPITYTVVSDTSVSGHSNDFQKFDISTDASGNPIVIVKEVNGLDAGEYYFKVNAIDANGDPTGGVDSSTVHITVAKTNPNLAFTSITDPVIVPVNGNKFTEAFTHDNTDTSEIKLTYSSSITGVATVDTPSNTSDRDVEVTPGTTSGDTILTVSIAATKNYNAASITKTIHTYPNISLAFTPKSNSFPISAVQTIGSEVGTITLTGDSADYTYSMATDPNAPAGSDAGNGYFDVQTKTATSAKTMNVVTKIGNVPQGTHKITMKAEDQYHQVAYISGTITVSGSAQSGFEFYDYRNTAVNLTNQTLTIYYGETDAKLVAMGGQSSGVIKYDLETGEPNNIIDVDSKGNIKVKDIGTVKVKAIHEKDNIYSEAVINMFVEVKPCEQTIAFKDATDPKDVTFDTTSPVIKQDAQGKIKTGMPNAGDPGEGSISYRTSNTSIATVDTNGNVTLTDPGSTMKSFTLTATINDSGNKNDPLYTTEVITKTIRVYPKGSATWSQSNQPQADNNSVSDKVGKVTVSGGAGTPTFSIPETTTIDNIDYPFFDIDSAGNVTIKKAITHDDLLGKAVNTSTSAYEMKIEVEVTNAGTTTTLPVTIYVKGATRIGLDFDDKDPVTMEITKTFKEAPNNTFQLGLNQVITGATITYSLSTDVGNPTDVISVALDGTTTIVNANEGGSYQPAKVVATIPMSNGYEETIVKGIVRIKKANQTLVFSQDPINTDISVSSLNIAITGHKDGNDLSYSSDDSDIEVEADQNDSDQVIVKPNGKAVNGVTITALASGDRNYNFTTKTATLNISSTVTQPFVANFPKMMYGDTDVKQVTIAPNDPASTYSYVVKDTNILDIDDSGAITIHHAGDTSVLISKTDTSGTLGPYSFSVSVKPRPITVTIDHKETYAGMELPAFTSQITSGSLAGSDTLGTLTYSCLKKDNTPVSKATEAGIYPITGKYATLNTDYKITIMNGELEVKQDTGEAAWYHLEDIDGAATTSSKWHKDPVDIVLNPSTISSAGTYDQIGNSLAFLNVNNDPTRFTVTEEGETTQDIYFRINPSGSESNKGAIASPIQETIRIDHTKPVIKSITGKNNNSKIKEVLNTLTLGAYFKPGFVVTINAEDVVPSTGVQVSGIKKTSYQVVQLDEKGTQIGIPNTIDANDDTIEVSLKDIGTYQVCATASDQAGNESRQKCETFEIKKLDVDVDGDGEDDFNDPDKDGCADFNIIYTEESPEDVDEKDGKEKVLNVDADRDGIPEMNIDSDGDGKPDINVDTDDDGRPDLNLLIMTKEDWKPTKCVTNHGEQYASGVDLKPVINVDLDFKDVKDSKDATPDINIDNKGDFKPHLNIVNQTKYGETKTNLIDIHIWKPDYDFTVQQFDYDTITAKPVRDIDTDNDGLPDLNIDVDNDGSADLNIDTDGDYIPNVQIDTDGDEKADLNIDHNEDGIPDENIVVIKKWEPNKDVTKGKLYDTMEVPMLDYVEDAGIQVKPKDTSVKLLPNYALKVSDVTKEKKEEYINTILQGSTDKDIVSVFDMELLKDNKVTQPDGIMTVRIPIVEGLKNPSIMLEYEEGKYKPIQPRIEDGCYVFETDYIGNVLILDDTNQAAKQEPPNTVEPGDNVGGGTTKQPNTSVKGTYTNGVTLDNSIGGASTGDHTSMLILTLAILLSSFCLVWGIKKMKHD